MVAMRIFPFKEKSPWNRPRDLMISSQKLWPLDHEAGLKNKYTFWHISLSFFRMRNVSDNTCSENKNTHFLFCNFFFLNRAVNEIMWKNTVEPDKSQMTVWRMRIACWLNEATHTRSEYVIHIVYPLQQWLHESASLLKVLCLSCLYFCRIVTESQHTMDITVCFRQLHLHQCTWCTCGFMSSGLMCSALLCELKLRSFECGAMKQSAIYEQV
jgi:hypothetical protein